MLTLEMAIAGIWSNREITAETLRQEAWDDADANGLISEPDFKISTDNSDRLHSRDKLNGFIPDYNQMSQTQHSAKDSQAFYAYYKDISKRMKDRDRENFEYFVHHYNSSLLV